MDNTSSSSSPTTTPLQASPAAPAPTPPQPPTPSEPTGTPPLSTTPPSTQTTPPAKKPFPLKWALVGIGVIVVLTGSILGILSANNKQTAYTTDTKAAGNTINSDNERSNWPYATLPNVMLEKDTLRIDKDEATGEMSIHGQIVFASVPPLNSGAECWVVWASTTDDGKVKSRVGSPFPKSSDQLYPPEEPCYPKLTPTPIQDRPKGFPGKFIAGSSYPAKATRIYAPKPNENEGVLNNAQATLVRYFDIYKIKPADVKDKCHLYLNYRSNRQGGNAAGNGSKNSPMFFKITLPECQPTPTKAVPTQQVTPPANVPPGCKFVRSFNEGSSANPVNNYLNCRDFCGTDKKDMYCESGSSALCTKGACRASKDNGSKSTYGAWHCCVKASCNATCNPNVASTLSGCSAGLKCLPKPCPKGGTCINQYSCQDPVNCSATGSCQCIEEVGVYPSATPTPRI